MKSYRFVSCVLGATAFVAILGGRSGGAASQLAPLTQTPPAAARVLHPASSR